MIYIDKYSLGPIKEMFDGKQTVEREGILFLEENGSQFIYLG